MQIKLIKDLTINKETIPADQEFEAQLIKPRSTTVEFTTEQGSVVRAFHYEYEEVV